MSSFKLEDITSPQFHELARDKKAIIIPFGTVEAHGSHLPLGSDTIQVWAVAEKVAEKLGLLLAPVLPYGVCVSTRDHPGTVTIRTETLKSVLLDLVHSLHRQGIDTFIIVSGHAGKSHMAALRDAGETLLEEDQGLKIAVICEYDLIREKAGSLVETTEDRHAGELETSRMLSLTPDLVKGRSAEEYPEKSPYFLAADKMSQWPGSVWGNPAAGEAEKGRKLLERSTEELSRIIEDFLKV